MQQPEHSEGFKGLNFNQKQTKLSKNPSKNIISRIINKADAYIILFLLNQKISENNPEFVNASWTGKEDVRVTYLLGF